MDKLALLRKAGCKCPKPLLGERPGVGPRCRLCNTIADTRPTCTVTSDTFKPEFCKEEHLQYLDGLRELGVTNMWGASPYLEREYPSLKKDGKAAKVLIYWMKSFSVRHPK